MHVLEGMDMVKSTALITLLESDVMKKRLRVSQERVSGLFIDRKGRLLEEKNEDYLK